jgi:hypothetical protein
MTARSALAADTDAEVHPPSRGAHAVAIGRTALDAFALGSWELAYARFSTAEGLVHSPVFVLYMARCKRNSGRLLAARELFRAVAREQLPADAPASWVQAVAAGHAELGTLQQNIPSVLLRARPGSNVVRVSIDGRPSQLLAGGAALELELDPGEHVIELARAGGTPSRLLIQLPEGRRRVPIWLPSATPAAVVAERSTPHRSLPTSTIIGYSALGLGAAGLVTGAITGLIAKERTDDLKREQCNGTNECSPGAKPAAENASSWAALSTISFLVGGGAALVGGGVLLFTPGVHASQASIAIRGAF